MRVRVISPTSLRAIFLISLLMIASGVGADEVDSFEASSANTSDGSVIVRGNPDASTRVIRLAVMKEGSPEYEHNDNYFLSPEQARAGRKIYFHQGPGDYLVGVFVSPVDDDRTAFTSLNTLNVYSSDAKEDLYLLPSGRVNSDAPEIMALALKITEGLSDAYAKTRAIHDWVAHSVSYDVQLLEEEQGLARQQEQAAVQKLMDAVIIQNRETALTVWKNRKGDCDGYANLTAALSRAVGIPNKIIYGNIPEVGPNWNHPRPGTLEAKGQHAWNAAWVRGRWVLEDTTLDSGGVNLSTGQFIPYYAARKDLFTRYFDPREDAFAQDHYAISEGF